MRIHILQHVAFEGPAEIGNWFATHGHALTITRLDRAETLPGQGDFDFLVVMGGPMGVDDVEDYPWLRTELAFIRESIQSGKFILGVCLGAQLIAKACGAKVSKNSYREIGWFNISIDDQHLPDILTGVFPSNIEVFHWHGDTFDIPPGALNFASSAACENQGFVLDDRVIALQFHIEMTAESAEHLIENCRDELDGSNYVQSEHEILAEPERFNHANRVLYRLLEKMIADPVQLKRG